MKTQIRRLFIRMALSPKERVVAKVCCEQTLKSMKKEKESRELSEVENVAMEKIESTLEIL